MQFDTVLDSNISYMQSDKPALHKQLHEIAIGNSLKLSPTFPPLRTVHATFIAHGAPSVSS